MGDALRFTPPDDSDGVPLAPPVVTPLGPPMLFDIAATPPPFITPAKEGGGVAAKRSMLAGAGLYGNEGAGRREADFYPTPYEATRALLRSLATEGAGPLWWPDIDTADWWEPTCGEGHICRVLEERTHGRIIATDLHHRGYGVGGVDFLTAPIPKGFRRRKGILIANPPYERFICPAFIRRAVVTHKIRRVAMLLKATYWHAGERQGLFAECRPAAIYPLTWRLDFTGAGSPAMETAWMVWDADAPNRWPLTCPLVEGCDTGALL